MPLRHLLTLARIPNLPTVWTNVLAAWWIAGGSFSWATLLVLAGASLLYAGGCTLNDAFDARWDREHRPDRLIPSGAVKAQTVWLAGGLEMAAGLGCFLAAGGTALWIAPLLAAAILFYDWRHKGTPWSVLTMGACRWLLSLAAGAAAGMALRAPEVLAAGGVLFLHIVILSLIARGESKPGGGSLRARVLLPVLPVLLLVLPWLICGRFVSAALVPAGLAFLLVLIVLTAARRGRWHAGQWVGWLLAGIPLLDALLLLALGPEPRWLAAAGLAAAVPLCRLLQQKFAAT